MTKEQAKKLYHLSKNGYHVLFTRTPYVTNISSTWIDYGKDGKLRYQSNSVINVDLEESDVEDFDVYERHDFWWLPGSLEVP